MAEGGRKLTLGSLFDGIGGFPLAAVRNGIEPVWASEIEAFPIRVTSLRFPGMAHLGDITKLNGAKLPPVDIITGGSPCQDLSTAGKRAGLSGERSGLFLEQIRIIKEMRRASEERQRDGGTAEPASTVPRFRFMVWENVPGAFSSAGGEDFRTVLEEICRVVDGAVSVPGPPAGRWKPAGAILGCGFSVAWRVLDAQYWGVPQRRKRIYLVADFGGLSAPQILFKQDSLPGYPAPGGGAGEGTAGIVEGSAAPPGGDGTGGRLAFHINQRQETIDLQGISGALMATRNMQMQTFVADLSGRDKAGEPVLCLNDQGGSRMGLSVNVAGTLRAQMAGHQPVVLEKAALYENHGIDARCSGPHEVSPTISARGGTGGNNLPLVVRDCYCLAGNIIDREPENGGNGLGCQENISYTLNTVDRHAVFARQGSGQFTGSSVASTQCARQHKDGTDLVVRTGGEDAHSRLVRRLTPLECERLQGFPDGWTDIPGASDAARYKALGNSVAIPCVEYVLRGIALCVGGEQRTER